MNILRKKIAAMVSVAALALVSMSVTVANATTKEGCDTDCLCYNKWVYSKSAKSNYTNDTHNHRSSVEVDGKYYYSGESSSDYNAGPGETAYASKDRGWFKSWACYFDNEDCDGSGVWLK